MRIYRCRNSPKMCVCVCAHLALQIGRAVVKGADEQRCACIFNLAKCLSIVAAFFKLPPGELRPIFTKSNCRRGNWGYSAPMPLGRRQPIEWPSHTEAPLSQLAPGPGPSLWPQSGLGRGPPVPTQVLPNLHRIPQQHL